MADQRDTGISWTDETWNPVVGCSIVSPACTNCYAMAAAHGIQAKNAGSRRKAMETGAKVPAETHYLGTTKVVNGKPVWTGNLVRALDHIVTAPLRWKRPRRIFVNSMSDLFHGDMPEEWIDEVFAVMALSPQHTFQILTKRPERMRAYMTSRYADGASTAQFRVWMKTPKIDGLSVGRPCPPWPLPNVWLGVTAEDQARADERIPPLLSTPAAVRFVSAEPLLGPVDFARISYGISEGTLAGHPSVTKIEITLNALTGAPKTGIPGLDWLIVGGESGTGARPTHPDWVRSIRDQCAAAGVAFHFKQWGDWIDWQQFGATNWRNTTPQRASYEGPHIGTFHGGDQHFSGPFETKHQGDFIFARKGKKAAGRTLDGRIHDAFPEAP